MMRFNRAWGSIGLALLVGCAGGGASTPAPIASSAPATSAPATSAPATSAPGATAMPTATSTPSAVPTIAASPAATALHLTPASMQFSQTGTTQSTTAAESLGSGPYAVQNPNGCPNVASISGSNPFLVTALGAGACTFTIADSHGQSAALSVGVTITTGGTVSSIFRLPGVQARTR